jgi:hypothetical protein
LNPTLEARGREERFIITLQSKRVYFSVGALGAILLAACANTYPLSVGYEPATQTESGRAAPQTPLTTYPSQVFATGKPGRLGLFVEGEDWHVLVDLPGFEHDDQQPFAGPTQFFFMRNDDSGTTASALAERIPDANSPESCRRYYAPSIQQARDDIARRMSREAVNVGNISKFEAHGKPLLGYESEYRTFGSFKTIHWFAYYRGFCFDFHFNVHGDAAAGEDVLKALDSLTYVPHEPRGVDIDRLFYFGPLRIRLSIPIEWRYAYYPPPPGPAGGIELLPAQGRDFSFVVSPLGKTRSQAPSDQPQAGVAKIRRQSEAHGEKVSPLEELCIDACVYYFDRTDESYKHRDPRDFPYRRISQAKIGDWVLGLSALYRDNSRDAADRITAVLSRAKVLDLSEASRRPSMSPG